MADQPEADQTLHLDLNMKALSFKVTEDPVLGACLEISFEHGVLKAHTHPSQFGELAEFFKQAQELGWSDEAQAKKDFWHAMATYEASSGWYAEYEAEHDAKHGTHIGEKEVPATKTTSKSP